MKKYDFDEIVNRENSNCYKYDKRDEIFGRKDVIPMWVADTDFRIPDFIVDAIRERVSHEIMGYTFRPDEEYESIISWVGKRHHWKVKKEWIGFTPGVVPGLNMAVLAFTEPGDKIIIQTPVYHPFYSAVKDHGRQLVLNPLRLADGRYRMDLENLRQQVDEKTKMLILCSPHNPTGNVWKTDELKELAGFCTERNILIISDEIHADIIYPGNKHVPTASISDEIADNVVTLMAPSKTFNFAGLATSYFIASNKRLFDTLNNFISSFHLTMGNMFGNVAMVAAYTKGEPWLEQLLVYLKGNVDFARNFINNELPDVRLIEPEATFLLWTDFRATGLSPVNLKKLMIEKAGLGLSDGFIFGTDGAGFQRINIGCPRSVLEKALFNIKNALYA